MEKEKLKCKICDKECKNFRSLSRHISSHNLTVQEYYDKYLKKPDEGICPTCGKMIPFNSMKHGYKMYCNCKCANSNIEKINRIKNTMLEKYGVEQPFQSEIFKEKARQTSIKKYGVNHPRKSKEVQDKAKKTNLSKYGAENPFAAPKIKEKYQKNFLEKYNTKCPANADGRIKALRTMRKNGNRSSLEDLLENFFIENNINYIQEYKEERYPYFCDFYLPDSDTFIEINGYWTHNDHFFNKNNKEDIKTLNKWKEKAKQGHTQYADAVNMWSKRDIEKLNYAKKNNLNYIVLWNKQDIITYITGV